MYIATWILTEVDGEGTPLLAARQEVCALDVEISRADCLRSQAIEQGYFRAGGNAHCRGRRGRLLIHTHSIINAVCYSLFQLRF